MINEIAIAGEWWNANIIDVENQALADGHGLTFPKLSPSTVGLVIYITAHQLVSGILTKIDLKTETILIYIYMLMTFLKLQSERVSTLV